MYNVDQKGHINVVERRAFFIHFLNSKVHYNEHVIWYEQENYTYYSYLSYIFKSVETSLEQPHAYQ